MSGDLVVAAVRDAFDDLVGAEPAQVVADLAAGHVPGIFSQLGGEEKPQVAAGEAGGPQRERGAGREERLDAGVGEAHARDAGAGRADDGIGKSFQGGGPGGGVVADAFGVQEAPVGCVACLRHGGEVGQLLADADADADAEVARLVEGGLGAEGSSFLEVLLDLGFLVDQVEVGQVPVVMTWVRKVPGCGTCRAGGSSGRRRCSPCPGGRCQGCRGSAARRRSAR